MMRVIGTAGHVDHGKSTLVQALTGIDPDRLREEKERQMTIDLGFAWFTLPSGLEVSIVDVPGHEDFIKNMLAGVGGIDLALLVVAADESVMPQTREHLAILDLLGVKRGLVALTKIDLVDDPEWVELVQEEVLHTLQGTVLEGAPIVPVSARTGEGLPKLVEVLDALLAETPPRPDVGRPRLPVDRAFSKAGFGTIVTGTLIDGVLSVGEEVEILPQGLRARIRGLQTHRRSVERATPGRRLAINLSGVEASAIKRGDVVVHPDTYQATRLVDVTVRLLSDAPRPLQHDQELEFFVGAAQVLANVRLIGVQELAPGEEAYAQLRLHRPVVVARGDRYILRQPSPSRTVGGGRVLDPLPPRRWRRFRPETLERFRLLDEGTPADRLLHLIRQHEPIAPPDLPRRATALSPHELDGALDTLKTQGNVKLVGEWLFSVQGWNRLLERAERILAAYHRQHPLRPGMPREELTSRLGLHPRVFAAFMEEATQAGRLVSEKGLVRLPTYQVRLSPEQQRAVDQLLDRFRAAPYTPPNAGEALQAVGEELLNLLIHRGKLVRVSQDVLLLPNVYAEMVAAVRRIIEEEGHITVARLRDEFGTSRKYAVALLEHLDEQRMTRRVGDVRVLRASDGTQGHKRKERA